MKKISWWMLVRAGLRSLVAPAAIGLTVAAILVRSNSVMFPALCSLLFVFGARGFFKFYQKAQLRVAHAAVFGSPSLRERRRVARYENLFNWCWDVALLCSLLSLASLLLGVL